MTARPWEADRPLTIEQARAAIAYSFPTIDVTDLTHIGSGWEFDAYLTSDDWVFRFPRRADCEALFEQERAAHRLVASALPRDIELPRVQLLGQPAAGFPYRFAAHRHISGIAADQVGMALLPSLARDIGAALGALHAIREDAARDAGLGERADDDAGRREWLERGIERTRGLRGIDPVVDLALAWASTVRLPPPWFTGPLHVIHQDLGPDHLIVDPRTGRLRGILDWTDATLGDPARDFVFLVTWRGWPFAEEVLRNYSPPVDRAFRDRLHFLARLLPIVWLGEAYEEGRDPEASVQSVRNAFGDRSE